MCKIRLHCSCDERFYDCLHSSEELVSAKIGFLYFNVLDTKCFREDYPIVGCKRHSLWVVSVLKLRESACSTFKWVRHSREFIDPFAILFNTYTCFNFPRITRSIYARQYYPLRNSINVFRAFIFINRSRRFKLLFSKTFFFWAIFQIVFRKYSFSDHILIRFENDIHLFSLEFAFVIQ